MYKNALWIAVVVVFAWGITFSALPRVSAANNLRPASTETYFAGDLIPVYEIADCTGGQGSSGGGCGGG